MPTKYGDFEFQGKSQHNFKFPKYFNNEKRCVYLSINYIAQQIKYICRLFTFSFCSVSLQVSSMEVKVCGMLPWIVNACLFPPYIIILNTLHIF